MARDEQRGRSCEPPHCTRAPCVSADAAGDGTCASLRVHPVQEAALPEDVDACEGSGAVVRCSASVALSECVAARCGWQARALAACAAVDGTAGIIPVELVAELVGACAPALEHPAVRLGACESLASMCSYKARNRGMAPIGSVALVIDVLRRSVESGSEGETAAAYRALDWLVGSPFHNSQLEEKLQLLTQHCALLMAGFTMCSDCEGVCKEACTLLSHLVTYASCRGVLIRAGCVPAVLGSMVRHRSTHECGFGFLHTLAEAEGRWPHLRSAGVADVLFGMIDRDAGSWQARLALQLLARAPRVPPLTLSCGLGAPLGSAPVWPQPAQWCSRPL